MKRQLRSVIERALRRLPVSRAAYAQRDILQARVAALEASLAKPVISPDNAERRQQAEGLSAVAQVEQHDPHRLEALVPLTRTMEERMVITTRCRDADILPKVANAGAVVQQSDGTQVQIMHNGIKVLAGGYYGAWMQDLIARCNGHHEPQEEVLFAEIMKHVNADATMFELGGFWSFYSIWFLSQDRRRRSFIVEADPAHIEIGRINARLNDCEPVFIPAFVGRHAAPPSAFNTEESGLVELPCVSVPDLMATYAVDHLDLLHCDAQGIELTVLESCLELATAGRLSWVVVSTHAQHISNDPLTHQRCLAVLRQAGAAILAEHDVQESFSGDGLIVAKFGPVPAGWRTPQLSYNRYSESLFRNPLYDLAAATVPAAPAPAALPTPLALLANSQCLALRGGLLALTADCALGPAGDTILLPFDQAMFPSIVADSGWALETLEFLERRIDPARAYVALDIGANVGLFTRQIALRFPNLTRFLCVEAEPGNFRALHYNVSHLLGDRGILWNVALSDADGQTRFFRDADNFGNYSLNDDAMRGRPFDTITVQSVATDRWMREHISLEADDRLVWKSDTQGYDELIISLTPLEIWDRVDVAIVELWRIKKPYFDQAAFCRRIEAFPNKSIGLGNRNTTADILEFLSGDDWHYADLYLWR
jgi:FkbM family methyltransferase